MNDCEYEHEIIKVGDKVRYLPTGTIFLVKEIYCDGAVGKFDLPLGQLIERRAVIVPTNDSGHYPIGEDIAKICSKCGKEIPQTEKVGGFMSKSKKLNTERLSVKVLGDIREWVGAEDGKDSSKDDLINKMSCSELFDCFLEWNGIMGVFKEEIKKAIEEIYDIKLN